MLDLRLQGVDVTGDLAAEGVELGSAAALILLALEYEHVLLQAIDGRIGGGSFQGGDVGTDALELGIQGTTLALVFRAVTSAASVLTWAWSSLLEACN